MNEDLDEWMQAGQGVFLTMMNDEFGAPCSKSTI